MLGHAMYGRMWQTDMADAIGVTDRTVRYWASGSRPISGEAEQRIEALARARLAGLAEAVGETTP